MFNRCENFFNRELSWLKFNFRVLYEAQDKNKPLFERLRFIAIACSNLDEFFMIRVAGLKHRLESGINKKDDAGFSVNEQMVLIAEDVHKLITEQYNYLRSILKFAQDIGIKFSEVQSLSADDQQWVKEYFINDIFPVLTPMAVDAIHPFPLLANRSLNLAVILTKDNGEEYIAIIPVPGLLPRIVEVPSDSSARQYIFLEDIIKQHCKYLFDGYMIKDCATFRITRNADLSINEEGAEDLLIEVEKSLRQRKRGEAVRLEIENSKKFIENFLMSVLRLGLHEVYEIHGPIDAACFMNFINLPEFRHLRYEPLVPKLPSYLNDADIFKIIKERDILLHHPYESFQPVVDFIAQAAADPSVLAIKQTLYRVSGNSPIVRALAKAAENGKQVTVVVELRARFDEENNIQWARRLEEAGCHVIYGLIGLKVHGKMALVVRQEHNGICRYVHMGTGNYNDNTARIYSDLSLFTANEQFGHDATAFFNMLSGYSQPASWNKIIIAPAFLRAKFETLIDREIEHVEAGGSGHIIAKVNSLIDKNIILKLYEASSKGVKIELIVRGICGLKPGVAGVSDNITVRSIVGRFLEHHRIFYFANNGEAKVYLSSADWMSRNLNERVEILFPIEREEYANRIKGILNIMLKDNCNAYSLKNDGTYERICTSGKRVDCHTELYFQ